MKPLFKGEVRLDNRGDSSPGRNDDHGLQRRDATPIDQSEYLTAFDANGNQVQIDHLAGLEWNYRDNIAKATIMERSEPTRDDA